MRDTTKIYAVVDTNVFVSSLFSLDGNSFPAIVLRSVLQGHITPLYNDEIMSEYAEVLSRPKFPFKKELVDSVLSIIREFGLSVRGCVEIDEIFPDPDDIVFYEVKMGVEDAYLVTGNIKHFPKNPTVVTPAEMVQILSDKGLI